MRSHSLQEKSPLLLSAFPFLFHKGDTSKCNRGTSRSSCCHLAPRFSEVYRDGVRFWGPGLVCTRWWCEEAKGELGSSGCVLPTKQVQLVTQGFGLSLTSSLKLQPQKITPTLMHGVVGWVCGFFSFFSLSFQAALKKKLIAMAVFLMKSSLGNGLRPSIILQE